MRVASIDIGSNSIIMLIVAMSPNNVWTRQEEYTEVARISEGLDAHRRLQEAPIQRALAVLRRFVTRAKVCGVDAILMTGTAPFRRASNGDEVARRIEQAVGVPLRVVSGEEEGALTLRATVASFDDMDQMRVLDIGGASTELLSYDGVSTQVQSLDMGVVRLLERFVDDDPPSEGARVRMCDWIREQLAARLQPSNATWPLVGVGGTVTSLAAVEQQMTQWDPDLVQGYTLYREGVGRLARQLWPLSTQERVDQLAVAPRRADVIAVGAWFLFEICCALDVETIRVSDRGIRWGQIYAWDDREKKAAR